MTEDSLRTAYFDARAMTEDAWVTKMSESLQSEQAELAKNLYTGKPPHDSKMTPEWAAKIAADLGFVLERATFSNYEYACAVESALETNTTAWERGEEDADGNPLLTVRSDLLLEVQEDAARYSWIVDPAPANEDPLDRDAVISKLGLVSRESISHYIDRLRADASKLKSK